MEFGCQLYLRNPTLCLKLYAHGMFPARCVWCVCDWCGEFNAPLYAHVCAYSGAFIAHGLG